MRPEEAADISPDGSDGANEEQPPSSHRLVSPSFAARGAALDCMRYCMW